MRTKISHGFLNKMRQKEQVQKDEILGESVALLHVIFDESTLLMGIMTPDGTVLKINPMALGFISKDAEVIGKPFWETPWWTHSPAEQRRLQEGIKAAAKGHFTHFVTTHPTREGALSYIDFSIKPVKDSKGNVLLLVMDGRVITEQKQTEEALRDAAVKYRIVADNAYNWEFWLSPDGRFIYNSPSCQRVSGRPAEEFDDDPNLIWKIVHPDDRHLLSEHRHDITQTKALGDVQFRMVRPDGEVRWVHHVCQPVFDENGAYLGTRGSFSDITKRQQAEEKNLRLASIVESSHDAIVGKTIEGLITTWNRGAERIFLYQESEVLGKPIFMLIPPEYVPEALEIHEKIRRGEHIEDFETVRKRKDGELIQLSLTYSPIRDSQGRVVAVSTIGRDITERKKAAAALLDNARIKRELEIAKEIQQSFLPACPLELGGMLMACRCIPAAQVGGDYYDFFPLEDGILDAVIADVTGHSVGSSLLMIIARSVLRAKVCSSRWPGELLATVNDLLHLDLSNAQLQISMFYARLDWKNRLLTFANAGHNPPFLYRDKEGVFLDLDADGLIMGVQAGVWFEQKSVPIEEGDILILYTDGITEAESAVGEWFGAGRLREVISAHKEGHPDEIMTAIFQELARFTGSRPLSDDVAMIVFKVI